MAIAPILLIAITLGFLLFNSPYLGNFPAGAKHTMPAAMQVVVTLSILAVSLYIILSHDYQPQDKHWAYGAAGSILGYWMKSK
jgi:hypothetical protein